MGIPWYLHFILGGEVDVLLALENCYSDAQLRIVDGFIVKRAIVLVDGNHDGFLGGGALDIKDRSLWPVSRKAIGVRIEYDALIIAE